MANLNYISQFRLAFKDLAERCIVVREELSRTEGALFLPHSYLQPAGVRQVIAEELTRLFHRGENCLEAPRSGVMCIDGNVAAEIDHLNRVKSHFCESVKALRGPGQKYNHSIEDALQKDAAFVAEMRRAGLSRLDLIACYRTIRILPSNIHSLRWSWGTTHRGVHKLKVADLRERLKDDGSTIAQMVLEATAAMADTDYVAEIKKKNERLMANLVLEDGERTQVVCSGVMMLPGERLPPVMAWRDLPARSNRVSKKRPDDTTIEPQPIFEKSPYHFYLPGKMPSDE